MTEDDSDDEKELITPPQDDDDLGDDDDDQQQQQNDDDDDADDDQQQQQSDDDDEDQQQQRTPPTTPVAKDETKENFSFKADAQGNLLDSDGKVLFAAGKPRAVFEKLKKALYNSRDGNKRVAQEYEKVVSAGRVLLERYNALKEKSQLQVTHGLTDEEYKEALQYRALIKLDPKQAVRNMLTKLHMSGTDLSDIGVNQPIDAKALGEHLISQFEARQPKQKTPEQSAREEAEGFLQRHPRAAPHIQMIAEAKTRFPHMTLDEIWTEILVNAARGKQQQQKPTGPVIPRNNQPAARTDKTKRFLSVKPADPNQSFEQIGRDLLRDIQALET